MLNRKSFIRTSAALGGGLLLNLPKISARHLTGFESKRPPLADRKFTSAHVEAAIESIKKALPGKEIAWLFENCFPNTLDTTVEFELKEGKPDTYVITGDIDAMWLRDSTAQVWPYLSLIKGDEKLQQLIAGVINRQSK